MISGRIHLVYMLHHLMLATAIQSQLQADAINEYSAYRAHINHHLHKAMQSGTPIQHSNFPINQQQDQTPIARNLSDPYGPHQSSRLPHHQIMVSWHGKHIANTAHKGISWSVSKHSSFGLTALHLAARSGISLSASFICGERCVTCYGVCW